MITAIYSRRSKEQNEVEKEDKSVGRQEKLAREFAARQGWTVVDTHVYVDDGFSGAEFGKRPGLQRLLSALSHRVPFQRLIVSEQKSIGREMAETLGVIKRLSEAGVEVSEYMHGRSLTPRGYVQKMMTAMQAGVDEGHRQQSSERVHEAHLHQFHRGHVIGGRVFGYRNVKVKNGVDRDGNDIFSHVVREKDPVEAAVVRRIFEMYDSGIGLKRIARTLTKEGVPRPMHYRRADGLKPLKGWCPSTVNAVLKRETYHGVVVWNKTRKRNDEGKWAPSDRPESEWIRMVNKDLRIIDEQLWRRVQSRREDVGQGGALRQWPTQWSPTQAPRRESAGRPCHVRRVRRGLGRRKWRPEARAHSRVHLQSAPDQSQLYQHAQHPRRGNE